jgi:hypothetical protein
MPESRFEEIEAYFKRDMKSDLKDLIHQENTILIIDDAQNIYHIDQFWALFKGKESRFTLLRFYKEHLGIYFNF